MMPSHEPTMQEAFENIYKNNIWRHGSGEGSLPVHTRTYVRFIESFLRRNGIKDVVDLGCGDWQFSRLIDWQGAAYTGYDIVPSVVQDNRSKYSRHNLKFREFSGDLHELPSADLLIIKDVLQHWSNASILRLAPHLVRFRASLITNCVNPNGPTVNFDIQDGEFRYLDIRLAPFNLQAIEVLTFTNYRPIWMRPLSKVKWLKKVLLIQNGRHVIK